MRYVVGKRVRCLSSGRVWRAVAQSGDDIVAYDEVTGEEMGLSAERAVLHSPLLIFLGTVIQTVLFAESRPLSKVAYLIIGGLVGSCLATFAAWQLELSVLLIMAAYFLGGVTGVMLSAGFRYVSYLRGINKVRTRSRSRPASREPDLFEQSYAASLRDSDKP